MKRCPECRRDYYDETLLYCLDDGTALLEGPGSLEPPTSLMPSVSGDAPTVRQISTTDETALLTSRSADDLNKKKRSTGSIASLGIVLLATLTALGYGGYKLYKSLQPGAVARSSQAIKTHRLTGDGKARGVEISPDGKFLAYIRADGGERSIWLKQIQTNSNIPIMKPGDLDLFNGIVFSPDGNFIYFNAESKSGDPPSVYRVPTLGGSPTKVLTMASQVQFSPDGRQISFGRYDMRTNETAVFIANSDGTNERKLTSRSGRKFFNAAPAWSPDGKQIAVVAGDDGLTPNPNQTLTIVSVADGSEVELGEAWATVNDLVWHPSGDSLIAVAADLPSVQTQLWEIDYPSAARRRITSNLNGHISISITADGKSIVTGELLARSAVWVSSDLKAENAKSVMPSTGDTWGLSWAPDGRIVYVSDQSGDAEVWIMKSDGSEARPLTSDRVVKAIPVVSPDGRYIVYSAASGMGQLVRIDISGGNPTVFPKTTVPENPDISLDSKWVIYSDWIDGQPRILRVPIEGGEPEQLTDYSASGPQYSHDGSKFACFIQNEKTNQFDKLAIVAADGGAPLKVFGVPPNTNTGRGPVWTPDDKGITLIVSPGELQNLWLQPVDGGDAKPLTNLDVPGVSRRAYSRDGKRIAIVRAQGIGNAIMITDYR
jgi:Tol biopolymer transport system component